MAVTRNEGTTFRCSHGEVFDTAEKAASCNLTMAVFNATTGKGDLPSTSFAKSSGNDFALPIEIAVVAHWIRHNTGALEHLIASYLDDCAVGQAMPQPATEKKDGDA